MLKGFEDGSAQLVEDRAVRDLDHREPAGAGPSAFLRGGLCR